MGNNQRKNVDQAVARWRSSAPGSMTRAQPARRPRTRKKETIAGKGAGPVRAIWISPTRIAGCF